MKKNTSKFFDDFFYYSPYFHDGAIIGFRHMPHSYILEMESAQLHLCDNKYLFPLSERNTLHGFLHIEGIKNCMCDAKKVKILEHVGQYFGITTFDVSPTQLRVTGEWVTISEEYEDRNPPYCIIIEAEAIYWENTANRQSPEVLGTYLGFPPEKEDLIIPDWYCDKFGIDADFEKLTEEVDANLHTWLHRRKTFTNKHTNAEVDFDKGRFGLPGHAGADHYHRRNPERTSTHDECLDCEGKACGRYEDRSHLYSRSGEIWK